jgi:CRP-like cAMP-binding protein
VDEVWSLRNVRIFEGLPPDEIEQAMADMPRQQFQRGEYIFFTGDNADSLYILERGTVKVSYITLNGDERILNIFQAGDVFGDLFMGEYRHRIGEAQALEGVVVCKLGEVTFLEMIQNHPRIGLNFIRHLTDEHRRTLARMHALMRSEARYRLLGTLLNIARRYCCTDGSWFELPGSLTQDDIAKMADLNRSTVSTLINEFRRDGLLGGSGRALRADRAAIEQMLEDAGLEVLM